MENIPVPEVRDFDGHMKLNLCKDTDDEMMVNINVLRSSSNEFNR